MVVYSCEKCNNQFSQKRYYNRHINKNSHVLIINNL